MAIIVIVLVGIRRVLSFDGGCESEVQWTLKTKSLINNVCFWLPYPERKRELQHRSVHVQF